MELPERKDLLQPWLPEQGLAMIHAPRGVGKTFFALSCAYAIGTGGALQKSGILADIAPTILHLLDIPKPEEMTGSSLLS